jgi:hypothetical protein
VVALVGTSSLAIGGKTCEMQFFLNPMKSNWSDEYLEILEFYYWEPQHLGKSKHPNTKYNSLEKVLEHIRRMEVSLNHIFNLFFTLLPNKETNELFSRVFQKPFNEEFLFNSRTTRDFVDSFKSATQPDLFFPSENHTVCIEMKVGAQSDFDQLMKYLLLAILENERSGKQKKFSLLFTGVGPFEKLFKEGIESIEELREQFLGYEIGERTKNGSVELRAYRERVCGLSQEIDVAYLSCAEFHSVLAEVSAEAENEALGSVCRGLMAELEERGFLDAPSPSHGLG